MYLAMACIFVMLDSIYKIHIHVASVATLLEINAKEQVTRNFS